LFRQGKPKVLTKIYFLIALEQSVGNLDLCLFNSCYGRETEERLCLTQDGVMAEKSPDTFHFEYDNGLLRAPGTNHCLGPAVNVLNSAYNTPYELLWQECPSDDDDQEHDTIRRDASCSLVHSRHMRFIITEEGLVQSLAEVQHPRTIGDEAKNDPYCLAMRKAKTDTNERAYLVPCDDETIETKKFNVYGTYSGSFLMPLSCVWGSQEVVDLAFQIGLPSTEATALFNVVEITTLLPLDYNSVEEVLVDLIPLGSMMKGGIISLEPFGSNLNSFGYKLDGTMTATLRSGGDDDGVVLSRASFWVSKSEHRPVARAPWSVYRAYLYIIGVLVGCFLLSVVLQKICLRRTRSGGDLSNDGKTVCMEEEEDDFPLEENNVDDHVENNVENNVEEGFGFIHISVSKEEDTSSETDMDIDDNRASATRIDIQQEDTDSE